MLDINLDLLEDNARKLIGTELHCPAENDGNIEGTASTSNFTVGKTLMYARGTFRFIHERKQ